MAYLMDNDGGAVRIVQQNLLLASHHTYSRKAGPFFVIELYETHPIGFPRVLQESDVCVLVPMANRIQYSLGVWQPGIDLIRNNSIRPESTRRSNNIFL